MLPAWNVERYLSECLDSILSQGERRIELVVVDDGSTDGTAGILARYAAADGQVRVIRQENAGAYAARNRLLDEAKGK
ncbi:MAG: glycosyltransferase family 2 protein [Kiritimatiellae bacterium]|nr:glycosyltransferase family 2 protein [Kiritimatiellia bacterium]